MQSFAGLINFMQKCEENFAKHEEYMRTNVEFINTVKGRIESIEDRLDNLEILANKFGAEDAAENEKLASEAISLKRSFLSQFVEEEDKEVESRNNKSLESRSSMFTKLLENIFGISRGDHKRGKMASRVIHPSSPFATGFERLHSILFSQ